MEALRTAHVFGPVHCFLFSLLDVAGTDIIEDIEVQGVERGKDLNFVISHIGTLVTVEATGRVHDVGTTDSQESVHVTLKDFFLWFHRQEDDGVEDC